MMIVVKPKAAVRSAVAAVAAVAAIAAFGVLVLSAPAALAQDGVARYATLIGVPLAVGAPNGVGFVSLSGTTRRNPGSSDLDGSAALGFGLGSAETGVGVQLSAHITSLTDAFGDSGYLAVKLSRRLDGGAVPTYVGVTIDHLARWGDATLADAGVAVALTSFASLTAANGQSYPLILSFGVGNKLRQIQTEPGIFAGLGVGLTPSLGASIALYGDEVELGAAWRPPGSRNFAVAAALSDAFDQHDHRRVTVSVSYAIPQLFGASR